MFKNFSTALTLAPYMFTKVMFRILLFFRVQKKRATAISLSVGREKAKKLPFHKGGVYETPNPALVGQR